VPAEPVEVRFRRLLGLLLTYGGAPPVPLSELTERFRCTPTVLRRDLAALDGCGIPDYEWSDELITAYLDDGTDAWPDDEPGDGDEPGISDGAGDGDEPGTSDEAGDGTGAGPDDPLLVLEVPDVFLHRARVDHAEGLALLTAAATVLALRPDDALARAAAKLRGALGTESDLRVDLPHPPALAEFLDARAARRVVAGRYWSAHRDAVGDRRVEPHVVFFAGGSWYARCVDRGDGAVKLFRVDRFADVEVTDDPFADRPAGGADTRAAGSRDAGSHSGGHAEDGAVDRSTVRFRPGTDTVTATVHFPATAAWIREEVELEIVTEHDDGFVARFPVVGTAWLATLLLRSGGRVLDPPELGEVAADAARRALANYR
jgi:predicted DNA-binding transcriptional regulator YafY